MNKEFIQLYDDNGYIYIVNINSISFIEVERQKVWVGDSLLKLNQSGGRKRRPIDAERQSGKGYVPCII